MPIIVKRALISCADKTGLAEFATVLSELGVELLASGGTAEFLRGKGLCVKTVEEFTGAAELLDGRVKTLHPKIHAGILARRNEPSHVAAVGPEGLIDLIVVNLYPFQRLAEQPQTTLEQAIEQIDIGGVALLRAAAKNFAHVAAICQPQQYPEVAESLRRGGGQLPDALARTLAVATFQVTSAYDIAIAGYLSGRNGTTALPPEAALSVRRRQALRYGENPHQAGAWYVPTAGSRWGLGTLKQLQGKELSYNNLFDLDAVLRTLLDFEEPTCVIVKHGLPCGVATAATIADACRRALAGDPEAAFGGIVGLNRPLDAATAQQMAEVFLEVIVAPSVTPDAGVRLSRKTNLRVVTIDWPMARPVQPEWRQLLGSWLAQEPDTSALAAPPTVATKRAPTDREQADLEFAWRVAKHARSNAVVLVKEAMAVGIGQGQPSRVGAVRLAIQQAGDRARDAVAASDGFFPFPDSVELLGRAGVRAVIQPGGSIRDAEVVAAADAAGLAMLITGVRHFHH